MDESEKSFCPYCGAAIKQGSKFCTECGSVLEDKPNNQQQNPNAPSEKKGGHIIALSVVVAISAVLFLIFGFSYLSAANTVYETIHGMDPAVWQQIVDAFHEQRGWTEQQTIDYLKTILNLFGYITIAAGVAGIIAAILGFIKKLWIVILLMYIVMTLCTAVTVVGVIVGIVMIILLVKSKPCFG